MAYFKNAVDDFELNAVAPTAEVLAVGEVGAEHIFFKNDYTTVVVDFYRKFVSVAVHPVVGAIAGAVGHEVLFAAFFVDVDVVEVKVAGYVAECEFEVVHTIHRRNEIKFQISPVGGQVQLDRVVVVGLGAPSCSF